MGARGRLLPSCFRGWSEIQGALPACQAPPGLPQPPRRAGQLCRGRPAPPGRAAGGPAAAAGLAGAL